MHGVCLGMHETISYYVPETSIRVINVRRPVYVYVLYGTFLLVSQILFFPSKGVARILHLHYNWSIYQ